MRKFVKNTVVFYSIIFIFFFSIFILHYIIAGQAVYGDGIYYYAYLHSTYFDHDLKFENEFARTYNYEFNNNHPESKPSKPTAQPVTVKNYLPPGSALLLLPFYVLADFIVLLLNKFGFYFLRNGYSNIYQIITAIGAIVYGVLGIFIVEKFLINLLKERKLKLLTPNNIRFTGLLMVLSSPLFYYLSIDVINSHFASFFISCLFFFVLFRRTKRTLRRYLLLAFILGIATIIRIQDILLAIPFSLVFYSELKQNKTASNLAYLPFMLIIYLTTISPLILSWQYQYGNFFHQDYFNGGKFSLGSLFDLSNGLFGRTPILLITMLSMPLALKYFRREVITLLTYFLVQYLLITNWGGWKAAAYGGRMYLSSMILFFLLSSTFTILLNKRVKKRAILVIYLIFVIFNILSIFTFMLYGKEAAGNNRGLEKSTIIRIESYLRTLQN